MVSTVSTTVSTYHASTQRVGSASGHACRVQGRQTRTHDYSPVNLSAAGLRGARKLPTPRHTCRVVHTAAHTHASGTRALAHARNARLRTAQQTSLAGAPRRTHRPKVKATPFSYKDYTRTRARARMHRHNPCAHADPPSVRRPATASPRRPWLARAPPLLFGKIPPPA